MTTPLNPSGRAAVPGLPFGGSSLPLGPSGGISMPGGGGPEAGRTTVTMASYPDYSGAQQAVDFLADNRFPVERTAIVGTNLALVETVLGRLTTARAALAGLATGAWFGLFIGLLFGIFTVGNWWAVIVAGLLIGAAWGAIFGAIAHASTGGRRDFTSAATLRASEYAVTVDADLADQARSVLSRMNWQPAGAH
ncbi:general stress protein [Micromonospora sp. NPDC050417]|uniref:general stress protein n=1 Tax=Micromonospora sp. NPDC050417 TaxID=3364280 RepID=UPI0037B19C79